MKEKMKLYSQLAIIPGGLTSKLQPLDLSAKKSFKSKMRENEKNGWSMATIHSLTLDQLKEHHTMKYVDGLMNVGMR